MNSYQITTATLGDTRELLTQQTLTNDELAFVLINVCNKLDALQRITALLISGRQLTNNQATAATTEGAQSCPATQSETSPSTSSSTKSSTADSTTAKHAARNRRSSATSASSNTSSGRSA